MVTLLSSKKYETPKAATSEVSDVPVNYEKTDMNSLAKPTVKSTTGIVISDIAIHQDSGGRYSLNDLHQASGSEQKDKPVHWLGSQQTKDLIEEILKVENSTFTPLVIKKGRYGGTYVCKELVYSYAMWISAAFALKVIRAYDDLVTGKIDSKPNKSLPGKITAEQQEAIKQLVMNRGKALPKECQAKAMITMWSSLKSHFGCSYKEISEGQFTEALSLAARVPIEGEFIAKETLPAPIAKQFSDEEIVHLCFMQLWMDKAQRMSKALYPPMKELGSAFSGTLYDMAHETRYFTEPAKAALLREAEHLDKNNRAVVNAEGMLKRLRGIGGIH